MISGAMSAKPEKVKVFQFGTTNRTFVDYDQFAFDSSKYDSEVETEFNRMKDGASSFGLRIAKMKLEININKNQNEQTRTANLYHPSRQLGLIQKKPKYKLKLLQTSDDEG